ncbi:MAG: hypothetical protein K2Q18_09850 [Bdellovibrionales bacterium]|nr:hypothetical protein [Bdellovibrionales bacterium]
MSNQVRVIDSISNTVLFETSMEKIADAYAFAAQMEEAGLDIEVKAPSLAETLIRSLGASDEEVSTFNQSMDDELDDHDDSDFGCSICPPGPHSKGPLT